MNEELVGFRIINKKGGSEAGGGWPGDRWMDWSVYLSKKMMMAMVRE